MSDLERLDFFLTVLRPVTVFTGRVNTIPQAPYIDILFDGGATGTASAIGTSGAPVEGNSIWFGTSSGGRERGVTRFIRQSALDVGTIRIAETDDIGPNIADNDFVTIKLDWQLRPRVPRIVANSPTSIEYYEDYDIGYGQQTVNWLPVAAPGPPGVAFLEAGQAQVNFVGDRSFALAPGATISSHLWTAHGSDEVTSSSQGTEASPVVFTWTTAGQHLVSLKVTDSNGQTHTSYTWVFVIDPTDPDAAAYTEFDQVSDSMDWSGGGGSISFTVKGAAGTDEFPNEAMVVLSARGTMTTPTATWPNRSNILFVGYIVADSVQQSPDDSAVSFQAATIDGLMRNTSAYPVRLEDTSGPLNWTQAKDITIDRAASFLYHWRSTLSMMTSIRPLNDTSEIKSQDFGPSNLYAQMQNEIVGDGWARVVSDHQSVLHLERDYQNMTTAERAAVTTRKTMHKGVWINQIEISRRPEWTLPTRKVKWSGIAYPGDGGDPVPLFSEAPGDVQDDQGRESSKSGFILSTQTDLNTRCGLEFARQNLQFPTVRMRAINDGSFTVAPQEVFPSNIEAADNHRALTFSENLIPRRIRRTYDHRAGFFTVEVEFEPAASGPAGQTVIMPAQAPPTNPTRPEFDPPPTPPVWSDPVILEPGAMAAADGTRGSYWTRDSGAAWERRIANLLSFRARSLIADPFWSTPAKQASSDPEEAILWQCGVGYVARSENAGKNWTDLTANLLVPPVPEGDALISGTSPTYTQIHGSNHLNKEFMMIAEYEITPGAGDWRGWITRTKDDGATWEWNSLAPAPDADGYFWPIRWFDRTTDPDPFTFWVDDTLDGLIDLPNYGVFDAAATARINGLDHLFVTLDYGTSIFFDDTDPPEYKAFGLQGIVNLQTEKEFWVGPTGTGPWQGNAQNNTGNQWVVTNSRLWEEQTGTLRPNYDEMVPTQTHFRFALVEMFWGNVLSGGFNWLGPIGIRPPTGTSAAIAEPQRPLAIDVDEQNGTRVWMTVWRNGELMLERRSSTFLFQRETEIGFGLATDAETKARTLFIAPHAPKFPGFPDFGNQVYAFGRWDATGTAMHIAHSSDNGETFHNIGDAAWTTERVGGFLAVTPGRLLAVVNDNAGASTLYESLTSGSAWSALKAIPFEIEHEAMHRHGGLGNRLAVGNNSSGSIQAAWTEDPYTGDLFDATGGGGSRLPTAADGGSGLFSIKWIGG